MNLFDLTGKTALVTGGDGNLGPIWMRTLRDAGANAFSLGLPAWDFSDPQDIPLAYSAYMQAVKETPDIIVCNAALIRRRRRRKRGSLLTLNAPCR